ncbi:hypothetical protein [Halogranum rubrum]|uniref:Uncharacterized protein n=1 Tax=Halogranum salarium B-1 TaxID=1210908 RepID=J3JEJ2_9EURY|nr:hypothetical protein [Halogranum salarium]EJN58409.1 hypothetical protein HSB1_38260 [Halogranum salarium B-1]
MDGDGGEMGGMHGAGTGDVNGDIEARMENVDGDSGASVLQSMGYLDSDTGTNRSDGESTSSEFSTLKTTLILVLSVFFAGSLLYFLVTGILSVFGVSL